MHVNCTDWNDPTIPGRWGQPLLHVCPGNLQATSKILPTLPTLNARAGLALEVFNKMGCGTTKMEGALGVQPSRVQKEPFTGEEIWGSMRAGQSPNCPKMSCQILAPVLAWGAEPKPLWHLQPQAQLACHSNRILILSIPQEAQDSEIPSRLSWGQREHRTRAQAWPALPTPTPGAITGYHQLGGGCQDPCSWPDSRQEAWMLCQGGLEGPSGPVPGLQAELSPRHSEGSYSPALVASA